MTAFLDKAQVEIALVELFKGLGYEYAFGPDIVCDAPARRYYPRTRGR